MQSIRMPLDDKTVFSPVGLCCYAGEEQFLMIEKNSVTNVRTKEPGEETPERYYSSKYNTNILEHFPISTLGLI